MAAVVAASTDFEEANLGDTRDGCRGGSGDAGGDIVSGGEDIVRTGDGAWRIPLPPPDASAVTSVAAGGAIGDNVIVDRLIPFPPTRRRSEPEANARGEGGGGGREDDEGGEDEEEARRRLAGAGSSDGFPGDMLSAGDRVREGGGCGGVAGSAPFHGEETNRGLTERRVAGDSGQLGLARIPGARFSLRKAAAGGIFARATVATEALAGAAAGVGVGVEAGPPTGVSSRPIWWLRSQKSFPSSFPPPWFSSSSESSNSSVPKLPVSIEVRDREALRETRLGGVVTAVIASAASAAAQRWDEAPAENPAKTGRFSEPQTESVASSDRGSAHDDVVLLAPNSGETAAGQVLPSVAVFPLLTMRGIRVKAWAWPLGLAWRWVSSRPLWARPAATSAATAGAFSAPVTVAAPDIAVAAAAAAVTPTAADATPGERLSLGPSPAPAPLPLPPLPPPQADEKPIPSVSERAKSSSSMPEEQ